MTTIPSTRKELHQVSSSSRALAFLKSSMSKPSVNQPQTDEKIVDLLSFTLILCSWPSAILTILPAVTRNRERADTSYRKRFCTKQSDNDCAKKGHACRGCAKWCDTRKVQGNRCGQNESACYFNGFPFARSHALRVHPGLAHRPA